MKRGRAALALFLAAFPGVVASSLSSCVDTTPKPYRGAAQDGAVSDGAGIEAGLLSACKECIMGDGGGCRSKYDACLAVPKCRELIDCGLETGCLVLPTLQQRVDCALPCFRKVGIIDTADPGLGAGLEVNACSLGPCAAECGGNML